MQEKKCKNFVLKNPKKIVQKHLCVKIIPELEKLTWKILDLILWYIFSGKNGIMEIMTQKYFIISKKSISSIFVLFFWKNILFYLAYFTIPDFGSLFRFSALKTIWTELDIFYDFGRPVRYIQFSNFYFKIIEKIYKKSYNFIKKS